MKHCNQKPSPGLNIAIKLTVKPTLQYTQKLNLGQVLTQAFRSCRVDFNSPKRVGQKTKKVKEWENKRKLGKGKKRVQICGKFEDASTDLWEKFLEGDETKKLIRALDLLSVHVSAIIRALTIVNPCRSEIQLCYFIHNLVRF